MGGVNGQSARGPSCPAFFNSNRHLTHYKCNRFSLPHRMKQSLQNQRGSGKLGGSLSMGALEVEGLGKQGNYFL